MITVFYQPKQMNRNSPLSARICFIYEVLESLDTFPTRLNVFEQMRSDNKNYDIFYYCIDI